MPLREICKMPNTIDTLNIYTRLKSTGISEESSKMPKNNLPEYFNSVCDDLKREIAKSKASFLSWMVCMLLIQAVLIISLIKLL